MNIRIKGLYGATEALDKEKLHATTANYREFAKAIQKSAVKEKDIDFLGTWMDELCTAFSGYELKREDFPAQCQYDYAERFLLMQNTEAY